MAGREAGLLDLRFFEDAVFARHRVVTPYFNLVWLKLAIFRGHVEITRAQA